MAESIKRAFVSQVFTIGQKAAVEYCGNNFLLTVNYTELVLSPEAALHRVVDFVGLPWDPTLYLGFHSSRGLVHTASALSVREPVHSRSLDNWKAFEEELRPLVSALQ